MNTMDSMTRPMQEAGETLQPHRERGGRLLRRTFLVALLVISGGLLTSGAVELAFRYQESVAEIGTLQKEMANAAAFKIQQFVQDLEKTMRASTQTPELITAGLSDAYEFYLVKLLGLAPAITTITALDHEGREKLKLSRVQLFRPQDLQDRSADAVFVQARQGASYFSPVYFVKNSEPYMRIAVPIERFAGNVIGVLVAEVNLKYVWDVIAHITAGKTGYAYVVSREGDLIAHPDINLVLQRRNLKSLPQVQAALSKLPLPSTTLPNLAGSRVFVAYAPIADLGWAVFVERTADEAYAPLYRSLLRTAVLLLLGLGVAVVASVVMSRRVVGPVEQLRQGAARIGAGALDYRIEVQTGDELEALATEFNRMTAQLQESYASLEQKVDLRTQELQAKNEQLEMALQQVQEMQHQIIMQEKMVALGGLVAGVAHEINTPVGIGVTAASLLGEQTTSFRNLYQAGAMKRSDLEQYLETASQSSTMLLSNLNRAAELIQSFKQVAVDQSTEERRCFPVKAYLDEILLSLRPQLKRTPHQIIVQADNDLQLDTYPGAFAQIVTNLVMNSLTHAFAPDEPGQMTLDLTSVADRVHFTYSDNGCGIPAEHLDKIFEPFFTTKRGQGGSGLGLHIIYNLVTQKLGGTIHCESVEGEGTRFVMAFPLHAA
jgi:two-component system NtrC family sensor kinase